MKNFILGFILSAILFGIVAQGSAGMMDYKVGMMRIIQLLEQIERNTRHEHA